MDATAAKSRLAVLLFSDIVDSTDLKSQLGTGVYATLLGRHDQLFKSFIARYTDAEILKDTGDGYFAAFATVSDAVRFALEFQHAMHVEPWSPQPLQSRVGVHVGELAQLELEQTGKPKLVGMAADVAARLTALARGGQILLTRMAFNEARQFVADLPAPPSTAHTGEKPLLKWVAHGEYLVKGMTEPIEVFEVGAEGVAPFTPPPDSEKARRSVSAEEEETLGWRPAVGLNVPQRVGWTLTQKLGEGTFGEVWLAHHQRTKQERVFKFCFDVERLRSFKRELTLFRLLRDALGDRRDIARLYDVRLDNPPFFLEGEFAAGGNLEDWAQGQGGLQKVDLATRIEIVAKVAAAVAAAHSVGVLHKDIKPSNVLVHVEPDGTIQPRLSDFGIGLLTDKQQLAARNITETGFTVLQMNESSRTGTRMYTPPETLGGGAFTMQGDIYALGVFLYQMVVADLHRALAAGWERDVSDELLREDISACVDGDPARRLQSAADLAERLRNLSARRDERIRLAEAARHAQRRRHVLVGASVALAVVVVLLAVTAAVLLRERTLRFRAEKAEHDMLRQKEAAEQRLEDARALAQRFITVYDKATDKNAKITTYRQGLEAMERLAEGPPPSRQFLGNLAAGYRVLGGWLVESNDHGGALAAYERSLRIFEQLRESRPDSRWSQFTYADVSGYTARILLLMGRYRDATDKWHNSMPVLKTLLAQTPHATTGAAQQRPTETDVRIELIHHLYGFAFAHLAQGNSHDAGRFFAQSLQMIDSLATSASRDEAPLLLFNAHLNMGATAELLARNETLPPATKRAMWLAARDAYGRAKDRAAALPTWATYRAASVPGLIEACDKEIAALASIAPANGTAVAHEVATTTANPPQPLELASSALPAEASANADALAELDQMNSQAYVLRQSNKWNEAAELRLRVVQKAKQLLPAGDDRISRYQVDYAALLIPMQRYDEADAHLKDAIAALQKPGSDPTLRARAQTTLQALRVNRERATTAPSAPR